MRKVCYISSMVALTGFACRKPYNPPVAAATKGYLVVEGVINAGADSTIIKLSRTVGLSDSTAVSPVTGASVEVVDDQNTSYPLTESRAGFYTSPNLNLNYAHQYRVDIKTNDGKHYQSDLEPVLVTPPIDSIGFNIVRLPVVGIQLYVNAHDAANQVKYFRWDYDENWEFHSKWVSSYISNGTQLIKRPPDKDFFSCYTSDVSSDIVLGSTAKLSRDTIYQSPLVFIPSTSEKIEDRYRIAVHQYALTAKEYDFWQSLKKNTEQLGSIFDAQPSESAGNIHCVSNPSEPVAGFVGVCTVSSRVMFLSEAQLPAWVPDYPYSCSRSVADVGSPAYQLLVDFPDVYFPVDSGGDPAFFPPPPAFFYTTRVCADCTIRGSLTPPPYWK